MPYERRGAVVYKADSGKRVGKSKSAGKAKKYLRTLRALEHGWKPTRKGR